MIKIIRATTVPETLIAFCKGMLRELSAQYEVVALSSPGKELDEIAHCEGIRVIAVPMERRISIVKDCKSLFSMYRVFRKEKPTMVHSMTPKAGLICMLAARLARIPVRVHTFTGLVFPTSTGLKRRILMFTDWMTCACATHIIPEGEGVKNDLLNHNITKKPLKVLGHGNVRGVDMKYYSRRPEVMKRVTQMSQITQNCFKFLFVGRVVKDKGINELCEAFVRLHQQYPQTLLWLVGGFEDSLDPISERVRKYINDCEGLVAVGPKGGDDLLAFYASADCFVLPSYREGFPNTVLEAGAMGLPSIVTDINGSREIIHEGENGMVVSPKDADALLQAMVAMMCNKDARLRMAGNARKVVANRFEQEYVRKNQCEFYNEILSSFHNV